MEKSVKSMSETFENGENRSAKTYILALGGLNEVGKNTYCIEHNFILKIAMGNLYLKILLKAKVFMPQQMPIFFMQFDYVSISYSTWITSHMWHFTKDGRFTVKSAYHLLMEEQRREVEAVTSNPARAKKCGRKWNATRIVRGVLAVF